MRRDAAGETAALRGAQAALTEEVGDRVYDDVQMEMEMDIEMEIAILRIVDDEAPITETLNLGDKRLRRALATDGKGLEEVTTPCAFFFFPGDASKDDSVQRRLRLRPARSTMRFYEM